MMLPLTVPILRKVATVLIFDYLLWNFNRFRNYKFTRTYREGGVPMYDYTSLHYTRNTFVRLNTTDTPSSLITFWPADVTSTTAPFAFIDNEFGTHAKIGAVRISNASRLDHRHDVCKAFPSYADHASFRSYVQKSAGYTITADDHLRCPLAPALVADLNRYSSGTAFADAVLSAKRHARSACVQRLWRHSFSSPKCPDLRGYLKARYDSLVVGLRAWGCAAVVL
uniref:Uncharacterized protein n=1 Tax=Coccolithus braarudii TaxID=221442 RepID=A0A7S0LND9_9EUKA|mmetsp:Transcript_45795/g.97688  ORF Transcript_45795/g.97688 Transcript_45795/m.97688 type:complete len:225 (+) Transcript_45795:700-1374(+)